MSNNLMLKTEVTVILETGSVITAEIATIEELDIMQSLCDALRLRGAVVSDVSVIRSKDVTDLYERKLKG